MLKPSRDLFLTVSLGKQGAHFLRDSGVPVSLSLTPKLPLHVWEERLELGQASCDLGNWHCDLSRWGYAVQ